MPGDLLRYLGRPAPYSSWWLVLGLVILVAVICWAVTVFVWTMPAQRLQRIPAVRSIHSRLIRRRFIGSLRNARDECRAGELSPAQAATAMTRTMRSFLALTTGSRAQYMHVGDIAVSNLAPAAPVLSVLNDIQFNPASQADLDGVGEQAEELIRSWS